jgi:DNA-binding transcriptional MocR family regulator
MRTPPRDIPRKARCWLPARAVQDAALHKSGNLQYLATMCYFADHRTGVTFASLQTMGDNIGISESTMDRHVRQLQKRKYVRRLVSKHKRKPPHLPPNRYQVLIHGDDEIPSDDEIALIRNPFEEGEIEIGGLGEKAERDVHRMARRYARKVEQICGVACDWMGQVEAAAKVLELGAGMPEVEAALREYAADRGIPPGLAAIVDRVRLTPSTRSSG